MAYSQAFLDLIRDPKEPKVYLISVDGYDDDTAGVLTFRFSNEAFVTGPSDTPANTIFHPRLEPGSVYVYQRSMYSTGKIGGRSIPGSIEVSIINLDGEYDVFRRHGFDGRTMTIRLGGRGWAYSDFVVVSTSVIESVEVTTERVTFLGRDLQFLLDKPIQTTLFAGTGGYERNADLKGREKPRSYGVVRNGEPERSDCALDSDSDASTEVSRRLTLHKSDRDIFRVVTKTQPSRVEINNVVELIDSRFEILIGRTYQHGI